MVKEYRRLTEEQLVEDPTHPVLSAILSRARSKSQPGRRDDSYNIGLAIEGGAMRGVVAAGMVAGLETLGLLDSFDVVYGTSAGAIAGAYFLACQARYGATLFYEDINNRKFIDLLRFFRGQPIADLGFIFEDAIVKCKPLDWQAVLSSPIPLRAVATSIDDLQPRVFSDFESREQLFQALRASSTMALVAGPPVEIEGRRYLDGNLLEAIPLPSAVKHGCTHILVLLTRPLGRVSSNSFFDTLIVKPQLDRMNKGLGKRYLGRTKAYARTTDEIKQRQSNPQDPPFVYAIAFPYGADEVSRLEKDPARLRQGANTAMEITIKTFTGQDRRITGRLTAYDEFGREVKGVL